MCIRDSLVLDLDGGPLRTGQGQHRLVHAGVRSGQPGTCGEREAVLCGERAGGRAGRVGVGAVQGQVAVAPQRLGRGQAVRVGRRVAGVVGHVYEGASAQGQPDTARRLRRDAGRRLVQLPVRELVRRDAAELLPLGGRDHPVVELDVCDAALQMADVTLQRELASDLHGPGGVPCRAAGLDVVGDKNTVDVQHHLAQLGVVHPDEMRPAADDSRCARDLPGSERLHVAHRDTKRP